ncbi:MAG: TlpA disulfide reductase family protein [Cyclobacteriaceae bacterium]
MFRFYFSILVLFSACSNQGEKDSSEFEKAPAANQEEVTPTTLELTDLEGNAIHLDEYEGKAIFLNLWATWCRPCLMEMPAIEAAYEDLKNEDYVFLAASYEEPETIKEFMQKHDYNFPFVHLKTDMQALGVQSIPTTFIYNQEGEVVAQIVGTREWDEAAVMSQLRAWKTANPM